MKKHKPKEQHKTEITKTSIRLENSRETDEEKKTVQKAKKMSGNG